MFYRLALIPFCIALWEVFPSTESTGPPNEWGTYYSLPVGHAELDVTFSEIFSDFTSQPKPETKCRANDADFSRWYVSSVNENHYILSYYCRTKDQRGYEHLKVDISNKKVLEFQISLKGFKIMDAGDYNEELSEEDAREIHASLLNAVKDQIALQTRDTSDREEICPDPGNYTFYKVESKKENGLYYHKVAISCNITDTMGYASHMTSIEVVVDKDFKVLNGGEPVLAAMEEPHRNTGYIRDDFLREAEAHKMGVNHIVPGFIYLIPIMWACYVKLFE